MKLHGLHILRDLHKFSKITQVWMYVMFRWKGILMANVVLESIGKKMPKLPGDLNWKIGVKQLLFSIFILQLIGDPLVVYNGYCRYSQTELLSTEVTVLFIPSAAAAARGTVCSHVYMYRSGFNTWFTLYIRFPTSFRAEDTLEHLVNIVNLVSYKLGKVKMLAWKFSTWITFVISFQEVL